MLYTYNETRKCRTQHVSSKYYVMSYNFVNIITEEFISFMFYSDTYFSWRVLGMWTLLSQGSVVTSDLVLCDSWIMLSYTSENIIAILIWKYYLWRAMEFYRDVLAINKS